MQRFAFLMIILAVVLSACGTTVTPPAAATFAASTAIAGTVAAQVSVQLASPFSLPPPMLLAPVDGASFDNFSNITLSWQWTRPLQGDEMYDVRVWREGAPHYGITWSPTSSFSLDDWLRVQQPGDFFWSVAVIIGQNGQVQRQLTDEAPAFHFTVRSMTAPTPTPVPLASVVQVPDGFEARVYAQPTEASLPTVITFGPDGNLYMLTLGGDIFMMRDTTGNHYADDIERIYLDSSNQFEHAVGMTFDANGVMYISDSGKISTFTDSDGDGKPDKATPIVTGLVSLRYPFHSNNGIAFGPDGKLYVGVGASTDHGPVRLPMEASILRMNPDGSDLEVFASGFRNPFDLTFAPNGDLFTADNSPDRVDNTLHFLPPEELDYVQQGKNYGFPNMYGFDLPGSNPPPTGDFAPPVIEFDPSVATSGLVYYSADQFPRSYRDGVFVAMYGTAAPVPQDRELSFGRMVAFVSLRKTNDGSYRGAWEPFMTFNPQMGDFRPLDVTVGLDGALYVVEWNTATVYRVEYVGANASQTTGPGPTMTPGPTVTPSSPDVVAEGQMLFNNGAQGAPPCAACHSLDPSAISIGPSLLGVRDRAGQRVPGLSAADYIHQSIITPNAYIVDGYNAGYMYQTYAERLTEEQINALVAYVLTLQAGQ